jgi:hypothetical protein
MASMWSVQLVCQSVEMTLHPPEEFPEDGPVYGILAYELISLLARSLLTIFQLFYGFLNYNYM